MMRSPELVKNGIGERQRTSPASLNCQLAVCRSKPLDRDEGQDTGCRKRHNPVQIVHSEDGSLR
eukprot:5194201-Prymnesium_polylepis.1